MAWYSDDEDLREALLSGRDLHQETADDFGLDRRGGKDINLGLGYGMSPEGLASRVGISLDEAIEGIEKRNARYPMANQWMKKMRRSSFRLGYSTTAVGRRVWINPHGSQWERNAVNNPIQGTAAEQIKLLTVQNHEACEALDLEFGVSLIVHDEVVVDSPKGLVVKHKKIIKDAGSYAAFHTVPGMPMPIGMVTGKSWGAKKQ
jgi:DNA polymerase-1